MIKLMLDHENMIAACDYLAARFIRVVGKREKPALIAGIPRGGISAAYILAARCPKLFTVVDIDQAEYLVDDLADSGKTRERWHKEHNKSPNKC